MKTSRRNFLKSLTAIEAISPFFDIDAIKANGFTDEQLTGLKEIDKIEEIASRPYAAYDIPAYCQVIKRNGEHFYYTKEEIVKRYGPILNCISDKSISSTYQVPKDFVPPIRND